MTDEPRTTTRRVLLRAGALGAAVSTAGCSVEIAGVELGFGGGDEDGNDGGTPTSTHGYGGSPTATQTSGGSGTDTSTATAPLESDDYGQQGYGEYGYGGVAP